MGFVRFLETEKTFLSVLGSLGSETRVRRLPRRKSLVGTQVFRLVLVRDHTLGVRMTFYCVGHRLHRPWSFTLKHLSIRWIMPSNCLQGIHRWSPSAPIVFYMKLQTLSDKWLSIGRNGIAWSKSVENRHRSTGYPDIKVNEQGCEENCTFQLLLLPRSLGSRCKLTQPESQVLSPAGGLLKATWAYSFCFSCYFLYEKF